MPAARRLNLALAAALAATMAGAAVAPSRAAADASAAWRWDLTAGFDSYIHSYALALEDTTETVSEFLVQGGLEGRSARGAAHSWRVRVEASAGTDLWRQRVEADYRRRDASRATRLQLNARLWARQYREDGTYSRSSDNVEGRATAAWTVRAGRRAAWRVLGWTDVNDYRTPSSLEVDHRELGLGAGVRSAGLEGPQWGVVVRRGGRDYPDSSAIDRTTWSVDADFETSRWEGPELRLFHHSERRRTADPAVRPHAWLHAADAQASVPAAGGRLHLDLRAEIWRYDETTSVYLSSERVEGFLAWGRGDVLALRWRLGPAGEVFAAGGSPEEYRQYGVRGVLEAYGGALSGSLSLEYGRRDYVDAAQDGWPDDAPAELTEDALYDDFRYWQVWALGAWELRRDLRLELMASWEPESHSEPAEDAALGYVSVRLAWRP